MKPKSTKVQFYEFVLLYPEEYQKLKDKFGDKSTTEKMENLNNYIGAMGYQRKYKSHYHVILMWARKDEKKKAIAYNLPQEKPVQERTERQGNAIPFREVARRLLAEAKERKVK